MLLFRRRQVVGLAHRRISHLELRLPDESDSLQEIALARLTGASKTPKLENQFSRALTKRFGADLLALLLRGLNDRIEDCLRRIEGRLGPLGEHQPHFRGCWRLALAYKNFDRPAIGVLLANDLPILPSNPLRHAQLIAGRRRSAASRCGRARRGPSKDHEAGKKGKFEHDSGPSAKSKTGAQSVPEKCANSHSHSLA